MPETPQSIYNWNFYRCLSCGNLFFKTKHCFECPECQGQLKREEKPKAELCNSPKS